MYRRPGVARADEPSSGECPARASMEWRHWPLASLASAALELLLVHPGGPFWKNKDLGAWSIPKGEYAEGEDPLAVAKREFEEETGARPQGDCLPLGEVVQKGGK